MENYIEFKKAYDELVAFAKQQNFDNEETIKWIVVKVLRLKRKEFDKIRKIEKGSFERMLDAISKHANGQTLSQIFGFVEFYGNYFNVTDNVFDPRLSTECLVDAVLECESVKKSNPKIVDLCTGSGCVAITISKKLDIPVMAVDISPIALEVAKENNKNIEAQANFVQMDLTEDWGKYFDCKFDCIVSNPPYWNSEKIFSNSQVVLGNPLGGFDGGEDGLKFLKIIVENSKKFLNPNGRLFLELDPDQEQTIKQMMKDDYVNIVSFKDHRGIIRVISGQKK